MLFYFTFDFLHCNALCQKHEKRLDGWVIPQSLSWAQSMTSSVGDKGNFEVAEGIRWLDGWEVGRKS